jgi:hypothetical protein
MEGFVATVGFVVAIAVLLVAVAAGSAVEKTIAHDHPAFYELFKGAK